MTTYAIRSARRRVQQAMKSYMEAEQNAIFHPLPNTGKTTGFIKNVARLGVQASLLQPTKELRKEAVEKAEKYGLSYVDIPAFPDVSPLMDEDSGWYDARAEEWYSRGMPPREIYRKIGDDIPTSDDPYKAAIEADWSEIDLLIGDVSHLYLDSVVMDRLLAIDDASPVDKLTTEVIHDPEYDYDEDAMAEVSEYLRQHAFPVSTLNEALEADAETKHRIQVLAKENDSVHDIPSTLRVRARTSSLVRAAAEPGNFQSRVEWEDYDACITDSIKKVSYRAAGAIGIVSIPMHIKKASAIYILNATPNEEVLTQWFRDLGEDVRFEGCLDGDESQILQDLNYHVFQVSNYLHSRHNYRGIENMDALVDAFEEAYGFEPVVYDAKRRVDEYDVESMNFARARGLNKHEDRFGAIIPGTAHYGDNYIKRKSAYCGVSATVEREGSSEAEWQEDTSQKIYRHMLEEPVFQSMMRIGRADPGEQKIIWIDTHAIPDFVPRIKPAEGINRLFTEKSESREAVEEALNVLDQATAKEIYQVVDFSLKQIYRVLSDLVEEGFVRLHQNSADYGADEFEALADELDDISDEDALTRPLSTTTIRVCQKKQVHEPTERDLHGKYVSVMNIEPESPIDAADDPGQLTLEQF